VGYRGYEAKEIAPLFPFGYGLSYTSFEYSSLELSSIAPDGTFKATFTIKNVGSVEGREVAQVYVSDPESSLPRPKKELHGFVKVLLKPGESKTVSVELDRYALSFFDERKGTWVVEAGVFEVAVGASSVDLPLRGKVELEKGFTWLGL
jgi:beta-glucosidase